MPRTPRVLAAAAAAAIVALVGVVIVLPGGAAPSSGEYPPGESGPGTINTVAGKSPSGYSGDGGPAREAAMNEPRMQTFDGAGTMYIVDTFNHVIRRVGRDGVITTIAGKAGGFVPRKDSDCKENFSGENVPAREAQMSCPHSAAVHANGDLYIADSANHVIRKVDHATGFITTVVGQGGKNGDSGDGGPADAALISGPKGIVFDANWNLILADSGNDKIKRVDAQTGIITTIAGTGDAGVTGNGGPAAAAELSEPRTLAVAPDGSIYFTEPKENIVRRIDPNGVMSLVAGTGKAGFSGDGGPATKAQLNFNRGVNVDGAGTVWIADSLNQRIRKVDAQGIITTVAGHGKACYYSSNNNCGDGGPAAQAGFAVPRALEFDEAGNLYVADTFNERIRRIDNFAGAVRRATAPGPT
jgi:sugar lactone lactonase YvrE